MLRKRIDYRTHGLEFCGVAKGVDERIYEIVLHWFDHIKEIEDDRIAEWMYVGKCDCSRLLGLLRKRWIDFVNDFLK